MTAATIINAAPMTIMRGTQDKSTRQLLREPDAIPTHLPKVYIYAQKGPTTPTLVSGASRTLIYGADSFDLRKKWANHATVFSNEFTKQANAQMIHRLKPTDANPAATFRLSLDVLTTELKVYDRNPDGSLKLDVDGDPIEIAGVVDGVKVKWVLETGVDISAGPSGPAAAFGAAVVKAGDQTDVASSTQSQRYPIMDFRTSSFGSDGNSSGIRLWAPTVNSPIALDKRILSNAGVYPLRAAVIRRSSATGTAKVVESNFGEQSVVVGLKPAAIDLSTDKQLYLGDVLLDQYRNITDVRYPEDPGYFSDVHVYQNNVDDLLEQFATLERDYMAVAGGAAAVTSDFVAGADISTDKYLFNMFGGVTSEGMPYSTFQFATGGNAIRPSEYVNLWAGGGSDGTMNDTLFADLVIDEVSKYNNPENRLMDIARNVESIIYDSGFPLAAKYALFDFMSVRKDTFVVSGVYTAGDPKMTASEENSLAVALRTRAMFYPESDYFGTPTMRALIMGRSGKVRSSQYTGRLPLTFEIASKAARYMGAGDGRWKNGYNFDRDPYSIVEQMYDVNVTWTSATVRNKDWDAGLNWVQSNDLKTDFIPSLKTVYTDDTSVLNSFFTAMAICEINKISKRAWRKFSGASDLSNAQLAERVNEFFVEQTLGRFDGRFIIEPNTFFTDADLARGFSWTTAVKIYAPNMKTVMTTYVEAYRIEDHE